METPGHDHARFTCCTRFARKQLTPQLPPLCMLSAIDLFIDTAVKEYYRMPMGHEHISFVFSSAFRDIFL